MTSWQRWLDDDIISAHMVPNSSLQTILRCEIKYSREGWYIVCLFHTFKSVRHLYASTSRDWQALLSSQNSNTCGLSPWLKMLQFNTVWRGCAEVFFMSPSCSLSLPPVNLVMPQKAAWAGVVPHQATPQKIIQSLQTQNISNIWMSSFFKLYFCFSQIKLLPLLCLQLHFKTKSPPY